MTFKDCELVSTITENQNTHMIGKKTNAGHILKVSDEYTFALLHTPEKQEEEGDLSFEMISMVEREMNTHYDYISDPEITPGGSKFLLLKRK